MQQTENQPDDLIARQLVATSSLDRLLTTLYVDIGPHLLKSAYEALFHLKRIALGDQSTTVHQAAHDCLDDLHDGVSAIRDKLISHEYEEPSTVSTMVWANPGPEALKHLCYEAFHGFRSPCKSIRCFMTGKEAHRDDEEDGQDENGTK